MPAHALTASVIASTRSDLVSRPSVSSSSAPADFLFYLAVGGTYPRGEKPPLPRSRNSSRNPNPAGPLACVGVILGLHPVNAPPWTAARRPSAILKLIEGEPIGIELKALPPPGITVSPMHRIWKSRSRP